MADAPLVVLSLAACGTMTLLILARALRDVMSGEHRDEAETEG
jgi:hypothetical protein